MIALAAGPELRRMLDRYARPPDDGGRVGGLAALVAALVLAVTPVSFLASHEANGAFAEPGGTADPALTAWAVLGLRAAGAPAPGSLAYLQSQEASLSTTSDVALVALAEEALGAQPDALLARLDAEKPNGADRPDAQLDVLGDARARPCAAGDDALPARPPGEERRLLVGRRRPGRLERHRRGARGAARRGRARRARSTRAVRFLLSFENNDGGFELTHGRGSDAQSTAWAIQGLLAAGGRRRRRRSPTWRRCAAPTAATATRRST